jgi:hypothetical protein
MLLHAGLPQENSSGSAFYWENSFGSAFYWKDA